MFVLYIVGQVVVWCGVAWYGVWCVGLCCGVM